MINLLKESKDLFLFLIPTCPIVDGPVRSCIYDLNRCDYYFIPRVLADFLKRNNRMKFEHVQQLIVNNVQFLNLISDMYEREYLDFIDYDTLNLFNELQFGKSQLNLLEIVECFVEENKWPIIYDFIIDSHLILYNIFRIVAVHANNRHRKIHIFFLPQFDDAVQHILIL